MLKTIFLLMMGFMGVAFAANYENAVHGALEANHPDLAGYLKRFIAEGGDPNVLDEEGRTLLHKMVEQKSDIALMEYLLNVGIDVNIKDTRNSDTALHLAVAGDENEMVRLFLARGADPRILNDKGETAFDLAIANKNLENIQLIFDRIFRIWVRKGPPKDGEEESESEERIFRFFTSPY